MKNWKQFKNELPLVENILLGRTVLMGDRKARIVSVVSVGETSRYDFVYAVKFQDGVKVEMHDSQIRPFLEEHGAGEEGTDELDDNYREDTPGEEELDEYRRKDVMCIVDKKGKVVAAKLTDKNAEKEISRHRGGTIVLDPDAKVGDILKTFAKESVELDEAWTADSVIKNAKIGSKKGYGITIKKGGGVTKTPYKHMLLTTRKHGNVRVTFDHGKEEFEGTPQSVALHINKLLGIKESVEESAPANAVGGGMSPHFGGEGGVQGTDPILGKKKKRKKFAGAEVFELCSDDYHSCMHGRKRYERWNKKMNMENIDNQEIRSYAHKNPGKPIVVQDKTTGIMSYLIHGDGK